MEHIIGKLLQDYERGTMTRRQLIQTLAFTATAASTAQAAAPTNAIYINHVSMQVADYTKTRDFYAGLFGMKITNDEKKQYRLTIVGNNLITPNDASSPRGEKGVVHITAT